MVALIRVTTTICPCCNSKAKRKTKKRGRTTFLIDVCSKCDFVDGSHSTKN